MKQIRITLIYTCKQCGTQELRERWHEPPVRVSCEKDTVIVDYHVNRFRDPHPRRIFHECTTSTSAERTFGLCKFVGYAEKEA